MNKNRDLMSGKKAKILDPCYNVKIDDLMSGKKAKILDPCYNVKIDYDLNLRKLNLHMKFKSGYCKITKKFLSATKIIRKINVSNNDIEIERHNSVLEEEKISIEKLKNRISVQHTFPNLLLDIESTHADKKQLLFIGGNIRYNVLSRYASFSKKDIDFNEIMNLISNGCIKNNYENFGGELENKNVVTMNKLYRFIVEENYGICKDTRIIDPNSLKEFKYDPMMNLYLSEFIYINGTEQIYNGVKHMYEIYGIKFNDIKFREVFAKEILGEEKFKEILNSEIFMREKLSAEVNKKIENNKDIPFYNEIIDYVTPILFMHLVLYSARQGTNKYENDRNTMVIIREKIHSIKLICDFIFYFCHNGFYICSLEKRLAIIIMIMNYGTCANNSDRDVFFKRIKKIGNVNYEKIKNFYEKIFDAMDDDNKGEYDKKIDRENDEKITEPNANYISELISEFIRMYSQHTMKYPHFMYKYTSLTKKSIFLRQIFHRCCNCQLIVKTTCYIDTNNETIVENKKGFCKCNREKNNWLYLNRLIIKRFDVVKTNQLLK